MKKLILILVTLLLTSMLSFSQSTYPKVTKDSLVVITPLQLKKANNIFLEHRKYKLEARELHNQVQTYDTLICYYRDVMMNKQLQIDSLLYSYNECKSSISKKNLLIDLQNKQLNRRKNFTIFGITTSLVLLSVILIR